MNFCVLNALSKLFDIRLSNSIFVFISSLGFGLQENRRGTSPRSHLTKLKGRPTTMLVARLVNRWTNLVRWLQWQHHPCLASVSFSIPLRCWPKPFIVFSVFCYKSTHNLKFRWHTVSSNAFPYWTCLVYTTKMNENIDCLWDKNKYGCSKNTHELVLFPSIHCIIDSLNSLDLLMHCNVINFKREKKIQSLVIWFALEKALLLLRNSKLVALLLLKMSKKCIFRKDWKKHLLHSPQRDL